MSRRGLFHKTFFFIIYGHFAVMYRIFAIYEQIYSQNWAVTTNLLFTDPSSFTELALIFLSRASCLSYSECKVGEQLVN